MGIERSHETELITHAAALNLENDFFFFSAKKQMYYTDREKHKNCIKENLTYTATSDHTLNDFSTAKFSFRVFARGAEKEEALNQQ